MSGESIDTRLLGLERRLHAEGIRVRPRRPHNQLDLTAIPKMPVSAAALEIEARLRKMSGALNIDGIVYQSKVSELRHVGDLGYGTCGHVVEMLHEPSGATIAVKQMHRSGNAEDNKRILMDLEVVRDSHGCPYIVRCFGYFVTEADVWICMELMTSCFDKILKRHKAPVPERILRGITAATIKALSYLKEEHGVMHRDVKPSNILVDRRGVVKLCDFGISGRLVDSRAKTRGAGCAAYMAPERISPPDPNRPDYDIRADVWSLGITLVELATGRSPYRDCSTDFEVLTKVIDEEPPSLPDSVNFSEEFKSFVKQCLTKDYRQRPKYAALLEHPFVKNASVSDVTIADWLASVLPPGSPRSEQTPIVRRKCETNSSEDNPKSNHSSVHSTSSTNSIILSPETLKKSASKSSDPISTDISSNESDNKSTQLKSEQITPSSCEETKLSTPTTPPPPLPQPLQLKMDTLNIRENDNGGGGSGDLSKSDDDAAQQLTEITSPKKVEKFIFAHNNDSNRFQLLNQEASSREQCSPAHHHLRDRSSSNTMYNHNVSDRRPHKPSHIAVGSPNSKSYSVNMDRKNHPFTGGGGGGGESSSFDNYVHYFNSGSHVYGSPEVARRQYFSPSHTKISSSYDSRSNTNDANVDAIISNRLPVPQFKTNGPTSYFTSTSVCTTSRFPVRHYNNLIHAANYHQNPGGSCSQPASLEAYSDKQTPHNCIRSNERNQSPALWSPQPAPRWRVHDRNEKDLWRTSENIQPGNTSPIVLQRFYHQQSQRRSRRDLDSVSRQSSSSLNRDMNISHSPGPQRHIYRDPSLPRDTSSFINSPQLREWRERERERERTPPPHHRMPPPPLRHEDDCRLPPSNLLKHQHHTSHECKDGRNLTSHVSPPNSKHSRDDASNHAQFEAKLNNSTFHNHMRERYDDPRSNSNKEYVNLPLDEVMIRKDSKGKSRMLTMGGNNKKNEQKDSKDDMYFSTQKQGKNRGKDKEEQGWLNSIAGIMKRRFASYVKLHLGANNHTGSGSRSSSPGGCATAANVVATNAPPAKPSRLLTPSSRRIAVCEYDDLTRRMQECPPSVVSGLRLSGGPPQLPPRRAVQDSWSLPASPLPTRPI